MQNSITRLQAIDASVQADREALSRASIVIDARHTDPSAFGRHSTPLHTSCIASSCRHPAALWSSPPLSNHSSDTPEARRHLKIASDVGRSLSCEFQ
jgi:hypothetical protein